MSENNNRITESQEESLKQPTDQQSSKNTPSQPETNKKWFIVAACVLLCAALIVSIPRERILDHFEQLEQEQIERNADMLQYALRAEMDSLDNLCLDWANWDDTYKFMEDKNMAYIESNIQWSSLKKSSKIDLIYLFDLQGEAVWGGQSKDAGNAKPGVSAYDPELLQYFMQIGAAPYRGILVTTGSGPMLISAHSIYPSSGSGISRGILIFGRNLDKPLIDKWSHQTQLDIEIACEGLEPYTIAEQQILQKLQQSSLVVETLENKGPRAYFTINDLRSAPLLASFAWSGEVLSQGKQSANYAYGAFMAAILLVAGGFLSIFYFYAVQVRRNRRRMELELEIRSQELLSSEERYRKLIEEAEDAIYIFNNYYNFVDANKKAYERLGYTREELMNMDVLGIVDKQWWENTQKQINDLKENSSVQYESLHIRKDGSTLPVEVSSQLVRYGGENTILSIVRDISARKQAEELLRQLDKAIQQSPVSVVICNKEGVIQYVNNNYVEVTGYSYEELIGKSPRTLQADTSEEDKYEQIWKCIQEGNVWRGEFCNLKKNGEIFWERAIIAPVHDIQGSFTHFVGVHEEITEAKLMEEADRYIRNVDINRQSNKSLFISSLEEALRLSGSKIGVLIVPNASSRTFLLYSSASPRGRICSLDEGEGRRMLPLLEELKMRSIEACGPLIYNHDSDMSSMQFPKSHDKITRMMVIPISLYRGDMIALAILANKDTEYTKADATVVSYFAEQVWTASQRQHTEQALRESQDRARKIFDSVQTGIVLIDARTKEIIDANPAAMRLYGGELPEIKGASCHKMFWPEGDSYPVPGQQPGKDRSESMLVRRDGSRIPVLRTATRFSTVNKEYLLESFIDLSERKAMEEELHQAIQAAEAAYKAKSMILANMSHEIRTPMNVILGYVQLMKRDLDFPTAQQRNLDFVSRSGQHLLTIINDILEMARIEAGHASLNEQSCDFELLLNDVEKMFRFRCQEKGLALFFERTAPISRNLIIDESKVRQVMVNLLGNAVKYTDAGSIAVRVQQTLEPSPIGKQVEPIIGTQEWVRITIEVEDSGCGIAPEEFEMVFNSFERGRTGSRKEGGTGLGLPISREFAWLLRGDLQLLRSQVNHGSLFRFTFIARRGEDQLLKDQLARLPQVEAIAGEKKEWRVLIVDDRYTDWDYLMQMLSGIGFEVRPAINGKEGIREAKEWQPHVILMDLMMPEMDGCEAIRLLEADPEVSGIPIIAISASVTEENAMRSRETGAEAFLSKPLREEELLQTISQLIGIEYTYRMDPVDGIIPAESSVKEKPLYHKICREDIKAMISAVESGDTQELHNLLHQVYSGDYGTIARLQVMAEEYDYTGLMKILKQMILNQDHSNAG